MLKIKPILILAILLLFKSLLYSQCPFNTSFGKIKPEDFSYKSSFLDSNSSAEAIILFEIEKCEFETNSKGWVNAEYTFHTRIKITNKSGFDVSTIKNLCIDKNDILIEIKSIKASTFNLVNNEIVETKLERKNIITKKIFKGVTESIFTLPDAKEGSIIEYSYTIVKSNTEVLNSWIFEKKYPCLYCEYISAIPTLLNYDISKQGNLNIDFSKKEYDRTIYLNGRYWIGIVNESTWKCSNISPLFKEPFVSNYDNYISKIDFRFSITGNSKINSFEYLFTLKRISNYLTKSKGFGEPIYAINEWLEKPIDDILNNQKDTVRKIFEFVRDSITNTKSPGLTITNNSLLEVFNEKKGSPTDINMLMIAMLRKLLIHAFPVILSTKENGIADKSSPKLYDYNHVSVCIIDNDSSYYFLDASNKFIGFKKLPLNCYNGKVIVLNETTLIIELPPDSLKENENTFVYISNDKPGYSSASCKETLGYNHSLKLREYLESKTITSIKDSLEKSYPIPVSIYDLSIDSLKLYDNPVSLNYSIDYSFTDDIVYFNPMMNQGILENPFKSATRRFPIEKPYTSSFNYSFTMEVPNGYLVDEFPKSSRIQFNEDEGLFEYKISVGDNLIQLRCKLKFNKATYSADYYQTLRDFYSIVVKKMSEQIVFKKEKKNP